MRALREKSGGQRTVDEGRKTEDEKQAGARSPLFNHLLILGGYALLTVVFTYPIAFKLFTEVPGGGDAWQNIWNLWWVKEALLNGPTNPYQTDLLYYPDGVNLYFHTLVPSAGVISIPLQLLGFNLIATYNLTLLLSFVLGGYGAYLLCRYLTGHHWASFVGGFVYAFSPYHFAHLYGHMNLASLQWIPFYALLLLKALDAPAVGSRLPAARSQLLASGSDDTNTVNHPTPNPQHPIPDPRPLIYAAGAGALLALNTYTDLLYGIFLAMLTGLALLWRVLLPGERRLFVERGVTWGAGLLRLAVGSGVFLLLVSPILLPTLAEVGRGYAQQPPYEILVYSSDITLAFIPSQLHPLWGDAARSASSFISQRNPSEQIVFLGYAVLALSALAFWQGRRNPNVRFWAFIALATWVLSLGPVLQLLGKSRFTAFEVSVPLPYLILYELPLINIMRTPTRLTVLTMLALAILVAFGLRFLVQGSLSRFKVQSSRFNVQGHSSLVTRHSSRFTLPSLVAVVLPALIAFEFLAAPFKPTVPPGWGVPIYAQIAWEPGRFALLELPLRPFGDYMAYQTVHGKPIIGGYLARQPPYPSLEKEPSLHYLLNTTAPDDPVRSQVEGGRGVQSLKDLRVKYVIIRWWAFTEVEKATMRAKLDTLLARPPDFSYPGDQVDVWRLYP